jgi:hypothetical protein
MHEIVSALHKTVFHMHEIVSALHKTILHMHKTVFLMQVINFLMQLVVFHLHRDRWLSPSPYSPPYLRSSNTSA